MAGPAQSQALKPMGIDLARVLESAIKNMPIDFTHTDVGVKREGVKLILPETMTYEMGIDILKRKIKEEQTTVAVHETVETYPLDGAYALMQVLKDRYGWAQAVATPGFFGDNPPAMMSLEVGPGKFEQVIWGGFIVPGVEGRLETGATRKDGRFIFAIQGEVKQRYRDEIKKLADHVRDYVKVKSVYKGKAIRLKTTDAGDLDARQPPTFLDLSRVNEEELTFSAELAAQVQTNLFTPIEYTEECRRYKIPLKRGVLLEGKYGTGKTLTAFVTAKKAERNGWTFLYLDRVSGLKSAINFAQQYGPAVIFAEDIDRAMEGGRTVKIDDILNQIDGIDSKGQELITILTSNHVENINKAMLRPGRLDAVLSIVPPDAKACEKLIRLYGRDLVAEGEDLTKVGEALAGQIPATIREVMERSKLAAIPRHQNGEALTLIASDLLIAAHEMKSHLALMAPKDEKGKTSEEMIGIAIKEVLHDTVAPMVRRIEEKL